MRTEDHSSGVKRRGRVDEVLENIEHHHRIKALRLIRESSRGDCNAPELEASRSVVKRPDVAAVKLHSGSQGRNRVQQSPAAAANLEYTTLARQLLK